MKAAKPFKASKDLGLTEFEDTCGFGRVVLRAHNIPAVFGFEFEFKVTVCPYEIPADVMAEEDLEDGGGGFNDVIG